MGKWFLEVVQDFDGSYYANMKVDGVPVKDLPEYVDYNTLKDAIRAKTGIVILNRKDMLFQQDGRKKYAYIDATQERQDCRVTFDEMKQGWKPKFDAVSITVYKDILGYQDDKDNLTEIAVPKQWLKDTLKSMGEDDFGLWRNTYTADATVDIVQKALQEGVILSCTDKNIAIENKSILLKSLIEQAAMVVDDILKRPNGNDLFFISNIIYSLSVEDLGLSKDELLNLTERLNIASGLSTVPILTAERIDAVKVMLEDGITAKRSGVLPLLTPEQAKKVLLNCELEDFFTLVDQLAVDNQQFYAPDANDLNMHDIDRVEKAVAGILGKPMALEDTIAAARVLSENKKPNNIEKQIENER